MQLQVGQKLWFVPSSDYKKPCEVEIKKIGRKWAHTEQHCQVLRIDVETLRPHEDDGMGQCYLSRDAYEAKQAIDAAWRELTKAIESQRWRSPDGVTVEKIAEARKLLGL